MFLQLQIIFDIFNLHAGVVQRLVCDLAKVEMAVRFRSLAPLLELPEHLNSSVRYKKFIILDIMDFFHAWKEV